MFINQKSQEISYALVRVAPYIRRQELRQRIERLAFQLLEDAASQNYEAGIRTVASIEAVVNLARSIYEIEPINAKIIAGEIKALENSLRQAIGLEANTEESPDVAGIFSKVPAVMPVDQELGSSQEPKILDSTRESLANNGIASTIRQSAILDKIRQSANRQIQLKDLIAAFPEVSERTMRYDLQKLCFQGLIERVGNGGPGSYYSLK